MNLRKLYNKLPLWGKIVYVILGFFSLAILCCFAPYTLVMNKDRLKEVAIIILILVLTSLVILYFTLPTVSIQSLEEFANNLKYPTFI